MKHIYYFVLLFAAIISCNDADLGASDPQDAGQQDTDSADETNALFDPNRLIDVRIELAPEDWDALRHEGRGLATVLSGCDGDFEYTYFNGTVTIDGTRVEQVGIRKKGFLGSLSVFRPSLKINFRKFVPDQTYSGMKRMTLNNDRQDPSHTHQVMSYALFRRAGVVAPRCNFARVSVNGEDLGIYSHVESIKKPFLARHFEDNDGNLYEGQLSDFTPGLLSTFELKTNKDDLVPGQEQPDLQRVVDALNVEDTALIAALEQVIDVDAFMTFWAMEVIVGHWDGYSGNRNNFYIYNNPTTNLFYFIPWGTDGAFDSFHAFLPEIPSSVYAWNLLAYRFYNYPETRALYQAKLRSLLDEVWHEDALLAEVDRIEALVSPEASALEKQRTFLSSRRAAIQAELETGGGIWSYPPILELPECVPPVNISGTFDATWSTEQDLIIGENVSLSLMLNGEPQTFLFILNTAGPAIDAPNGIPKDYAMIQLVATRLEGNPLVVVIFLPPQLVKVGEPMFHGFETLGVVVEIIDGPDNVKLLGYIGDGTISFAAAGTAEGDQVSGSFSGMLSSYGDALAGHLLPSGIFSRTWMRQPGASIP
ncbi:MAG: CotH kinase family protein [Myxococcota bacterium]|nr:CotH kinase family protein [Myxococcota bacterium]